MGDIHLGLIEVQSSKWRNCCLAVFYWQRLYPRLWAFMDSDIRSVLALAIHLEVLEGLAMAVLAMEAMGVMAVMERDMAAMERGMAAMAVVIAKTMVETGTSGQQI